MHLYLFYHMSYRLINFSLISNVYYIGGNEITLHPKLLCNSASYMRQQASLVRPADGYMTQTISLLLQIMTCRLPRTKSLLKPVLTTCKLYPTGTNFHEIKKKVYTRSRCTKVASQYHTFSWLSGQRDENPCVYYIYITTLLLALGSD